MKDYYQILHVRPDASVDEIKQSYRLLAKEFHPDVNKSPDAQEKFCEITEAYDYLINHLKQPAFTQTYESYPHAPQNNEAYEKFVNEARERAKRQARMRYEKFKKQHEAFQESGINDIALLFTMFMRLFSLFLFLFLFLTPFVLAVAIHWSGILVLFLTWPFAFGIGWYYHDNRKNYFKPGEFYYSFSRIMNKIKYTHPSSEKCFYCPSKAANSAPYKLELLKLKDIKLNKDSNILRSANYVTKSISIFVPRSQKALIIHTLTVLIKVMCITGCLVFLNIPSLVWRLIAGFAGAAVLSRILLTAFSTRSNISYLYNPGFFIRIFLWMTAICLASRFHFDPLRINTTDIIHFIIAVILMFDCLVMQLINVVMGKTASWPLSHQPPEIIEKFNEGYRVYNDIPVISILFPVFKWIFG
jgi:DnaJ-domain-containing protein 1